MALTSLKLSHIQLVFKQLVLLYSIQHDYLPPAFPAGFRLLGLLVVTSAPYRTYRGVAADDTLHVAGNSLHVRFLRPIPLYGLLQAEYGEQSHFHPPGRPDLTLKSAS